MAMATDLGLAAADDLAREMLRRILRGFNVDGPPRPRVLLAHAMVRGSQTSVSQPPLVGQDLELAIDDLALAGADFVALGHIHLGQSWDTDGEIPIVYPGSPRRCNYGETETKSYVVAEFDGRGCVQWDRVETPCPPMIHVSGAFADGALKFDVNEHGIADVRGAEIRVRYDVNARDREAAKLAAEQQAALLRAGGAIVKIEERIAIDARARAPEVASAASVADKLVAHWKAKGAMPERLDHLLAKLDALESP
jgi:DNA repair exonuclease SbcCD nuclease subunit